MAASPKRKMMMGGMIKPPATPPEQSMILRDKMFRRPPANLQDIARTNTNATREKFFGGRGVQQQPGLDMVSLGVPSRELMQGEGNEWQPADPNQMLKRRPGTMNFNQGNPQDMQKILEQFYAGRNVRGL